MPRTPTPRRRCSTSPISRRTRGRRRGRSPSSITAARGRPRSGCTWARSGRAASSPPTTPTRRRRRTRWSTTTTACWTPPTSSSSTRPAPGFGRIEGRDKERAFYGTDPDADAFTSFITQFLGRYGRYNSPKYLFGESYGHHPLGDPGVPAGAREGHRPERRHAAVADPGLRQQHRRAAVQPERRPALHPGAAELRRHRLLPPQAPQPARRPAALPGRGGAFRAHRLHLRAAAGHRAVGPPTATASPASCTTIPGCRSTTSGRRTCA